MKTISAVGLSVGLMVGGLTLGITGCSQQVAMGDSVREMMQAQTDTDISADNVGGAMAGIGDHVGAAYRGDVDHPGQVKDSMTTSFIGKK